MPHAYTTAAAPAAATAGTTPARITQPYGGAMALKEQLRADLTAAMKARDELRAATLRMVLTAVTNEEVAGKKARELSDDEVLQVLTREAKKRREAQDAYVQAGRTELADREQAEHGVIETYLPQQLGAD